MKVDILCSGSSGNCAVIDDYIIIDVGTKKEIQKGSLVLITHHHSDHTKGLPNVNGLPMYCTDFTAEKIRLNPDLNCMYAAFNIIKPNVPFFITKVDSIKDITSVSVILDEKRVGYSVGGYVDRYENYMITPLSLIHDVPCVAFDILKTVADGEDERIFFGTDFSQIVEDDMFVDLLRRRKYDALYIECNNTLTHGDFDDIYFADGKLPKDEFHRRRSWNNHCNVSYLIGLFERAGYSKEKRFPEPVTLLHKSSYYYNKNQEYLVSLLEIANVTNIFL